MDDQQINLNRFNLFFPEKRPFFLENAGLTRRGYRSTNGRVLRTFRFGEDAPLNLHEFRPHVSYNVFWDFAGLKETQFVHIDNHTEFKNGAQIHTGMNLTTEGVTEAFEIFPGVVVPRGTYDHNEALEITLHHVLTMTAGFEWNEMTPDLDMNDEFRLNQASDPVRYAMSKPIVSEPGSTFNYSGGASQVLATVISRLTGSMLREYALERLFTPLGITEFEWLGPPAWSSGDAAAASGLRLKARDLAKIGSLYLHGGRWRGRQVVPEAWVSRSTMRHVAEAWIAAETISQLSAAGKAATKDAWFDDNTVVGYGYQWWVGELPSGERVVLGTGVGDQKLFVLPSERLVVTIFAGQYNASEPYSDRILQRVLAAR